MSQLDAYHCILAYLLLLDSSVPFARVQRSPLYEPVAQGHKQMELLKAVEVVLLHAVIAIKLTYCVSYL